MVFIEEIAESSPPSTETHTAAGATDEHLPTAEEEEAPKQIETTNPVDDHSKATASKEDHDGADTQNEDPKTLFASGRWREAKDAWGRSLKSCNYILARSSRTGGAGGGDDDDDEDGEKLSDAKLNEFQELKQKTLLNLALVSLKLREFGDAVTFSNEVLSTNPNHVKARYRMALGQYEMGKVKDCVKTLKPIEKDTDPEIQRLVRCSQRAVQKQRQVEAKMAEGLRDPDLQAYDAVKQGVWWRQRRSWVIGAACVGGAIWWLLNKRGGRGAQAAGQV